MTAKNENSDSAKKKKNKREDVEETFRRVKDAMKKVDEDLQKIVEIDRKEQET